jgi:glycosyltransferase involved in cell wall biosynthesis
MSQVVRQHPEVRYLVLGETHPVVHAEHGEEYRDVLRACVATLQLTNHVTFINKLLTSQEIVESLVASDLCLTPYLGEDQAVSGTLAYDIGYGRAVVSTPYRYATELLAEGRGRLSPFRNPTALAENITDLLNHPQTRTDMEHKASALGKTMRWREVALTYAALFRRHLPHQLPEKRTRSYDEFSGNAAPASGILASSH